MSRSKVAIMPHSETHTVQHRDHNVSVLVKISHVSDRVTIQKQSHANDRSGAGFTFIDSDPAIIQAVGETLTAAGKLAVKRQEELNGSPKAKSTKA